MNYVPRSVSKLRPPKRVNKGNLNRPSTGHWNGPRVPAVSHDKCASLVRGIQNYHMDAKGWNDIAYNFVVCRHGYVFEGRGLNVINGANGTNEGNRTSHAVMWLAGEGNPFTDAEKHGFREAVKYIDRMTNAPYDAIGHRDHKSTECPGDERYNWISQGMPGHTVTPSVPNLPIVTGAPVLRIGSKGDAVVLLQTVLRNKAGQKDVRVDGVFGPATHEGVKNIQRYFKLTPTPDGVVGPKTWGVIQYLMNN